MRNALATTLAKNIYSLYLLQGVNYFLPLVILPYILRTLGPQAYGAISFAQSLMAYCVILTDFGFNFTATRAISMARGDTNEVSRIFWTTLSTKGLLLLFLILVLVPTVVASSTLRAHGSVIAICSLSVAGSVLVPQWYFQGLEKIRILVAVQALSRLCTLSLIFVLITSPQDELLAAALLSTPQVLAGILSIVIATRRGSLTWYRPNVRDVTQALSQSRHLFISNLATSAYVAGNGFILGLLCGDHAVALYTLANKAALATFYMSLPVSLAVFPRASLLFSKSLDEARSFVRRLALPFLCAAALASALLVAFAGPIVHALAGSQYSEATQVLRIMGPLPFLLSAATILAQIIMINIGLTQSLSRIYLAMGSFSLLSLPILAKLWGAPGGAASLVLIETIGPTLMALKLKQVGFFSRRATS